MAVTECIPPSSRYRREVAIRQRRSTILTRRSFRRWVLASSHDLPHSLPKGSLLRRRRCGSVSAAHQKRRGQHSYLRLTCGARSEERRVAKEGGWTCSSGWCRCHKKKKRDK